MLLIEVSCTSNEAGFPRPLTDFRQLKLAPLAGANAEESLANQFVPSARERHLQSASCL